MSNHLFTGAAGLIIGLIAGFFIANSINRSAAPTHPSATPGATMGGTQTGEDGQSAAMMADVASVLERAKNEPDNFEIQAQAGDMYAQIGRFDRAIEFLSRAAELKPDDFKANVALANAYFDTKQYDDAQKFYMKALEIKPDDVNARTDLGTTFVERENPDYERGIKEFEEVLTRQPDHEPTLYNLGVAYHRRGDAENAARILAKLESLSPKSELAGRLRQNIEKK